jgi:hypothetical protein
MSLSYSPLEFPSSEMFCPINNMSFMKICQEVVSIIVPDIKGRKGQKIRLEMKRMGCKELTGN